MNLRDLQYLVAVADLRHFGKAAEACHVSQPTLSAQVAKLEDYLGVMLFERTPRAVHVTPVGENIVASARLALEHARRVVEIARESRDPLSGELRIGVIPTLAPYLMPWLLRPMRERFPNLTVTLAEEPTERLLERLGRHELDAALLATSIDEEPGLRAMPLFREPFWIACPRDHALATLVEVTRADLAAAGLLLLTDEHCLRNQALDVCRYRSKSPTAAMPDLRATSLETLLELVSAGLGCTLIPALATRGPWARAESLVLREILLPGATRDVVLAYRDSFPRTEALTAFAQLVLDVVPRDLVRPSPGEGDGAERKTVAGKGAGAGARMALARSKV